MKPHHFQTGQRGLAQPLNEMSSEISRHGVILDETIAGAETTIGSHQQRYDNPDLEQGFPYGEIFSFGIFINGAKVTIYNGKLFEGPGAGHEISNGDGDNNVLITCTTNPTWVAAKFVFATNTLTIENMDDVEPYPDMVTGQYHRRLYKFRFSNNRAYLERCCLFDIHLPGTWGRP